MALGVLNNLSAIYAENNLNNTSNSLQNVLRQLSSGSRINSGADDAAGLSLINGLQANSSALTQSRTNSTEGVGLLEVADGALSQVTSLLNRAITLATEASNGTLNPTQESAANQEYQSIMSEINNIGSTTTYNQQRVFSGQTISIYTGDSSTTGSSIDNLNIRTLSAASVGDTNGVMSYSDGRNNVFLNLSSNTANAQITDVLNPSGATTIDVNYLVKGTVGGSSTASTQISVGTGTTYANTAGGLISAINNAGLGLTASFTTQAKAGVTGGGMQTGIQIFGGLVSAGVDPSSASTAGTLNPNGIPADQLLTQGQTITIKQGGSVVGSPIVIDPTLNTLDEVAGYINDVSNGYSTAVKASVVTNGDGTESLSLANATPTGGALTVTTTSGPGAAIPAFGPPTPVAMDAPPLATTIGAPVTGVTTVPARQGSYTFGVAGTNASGDKLSDGASVTLINSLASGSVTATFIVGTGANGAGTYYTDATNGVSRPSTLAGLAATIQASALGVTATTGASGITVSSLVSANGDNITISGPNTLTNANNILGLYAPTMGGVGAQGTKTVTELAAGAGSLNDTIAGTINLSNGNPADNFTYTATGSDSYAELALAINGSNLSVTATWDVANRGLKLTSTASGAPAITVAAGTTLVDSVTATNVTVNAAQSSVGAFGAPASSSTAVMQLANGAAMVDVSANLTGTFTLNYNSNSQVFIMGANPGAGAVAGAIYTGANTVASLVTAINGAAALGLSATLPGTGVGGDSGGIYLQGTPSVTSQITLTASTLASTVPETTNSSLTGVTAVTGIAATKTVGIAPSAVGTISTGDVLADGSITLTNAGGTPWTFTINSTGTGVAANTTYIASGATLADLANKISSTNGTTGLGLTALASTSGLTFTQNTPSGASGGGIVITSSLTDATLGSYSTTLLGPFASKTDTVSGTMSFAVGVGSPQSVTVASGSTVNDMIDQINGNSAALGVKAKWVGTANGFGNVVLTSNAEGTAGQLGTLTTSIVDTTTTANLSYTAAGAYDIALTSDSGNVVFDSTSGQNGTTGAATFVSNEKSGSGAAVTSYSSDAGISLAGTSLLSQSSAQSALSSLNQAISDVASMDGYIGAQINVLNSISQVMSTQQENLTSAQNAIQATDYASATANMSKYEILSQTGIAALAQANTVQQEVTKLLQ